MKETKRQKFEIKKILEVYFIAGSQDIVSGSLPEVLEAALKAGITCFQFREKGIGSISDKDLKKELALKCQSLCQKYQVPFIVNDDVLLAIEINADGIHIGQEDLSANQALELTNRQMIIGLSCHNLPEVIAGNSLSNVTYFGIGPIFKTISKPDAKSALGCERLKLLVNQAQKPVVAIGGIKIENAPEVKATGVAGISVISMIARAKDINQVVTALK
ncbi:MAG: thiamine phosphate synthase [Streptococcaceae bacterium]|jgi:thiamine-phosphate pyrophosphorylase|nr:thiamine phosphate synthase [Streptococcaceae bacterium]